MKILLLSISILLILSGCSAADKVVDMRDKDYTQGCVVVEAGLKLGYFNQAGEAEVCKLKCSDTLPEDFMYDYNNSRTGCHVGINLKR